MPWTTLRTFTTPNFRVDLAYDYDDSTNPLEYMEPNDAAEVLAKLESGEWGNYVFRVTVTTDSGLELAEESLWGAIYADPAEFMDHREAGRQSRAGRNCGSYFSDMIGNACHEARRTVAGMRRLQLRDPDSGSHASAATTDANNDSASSAFLA